MKFLILIGLIYTPYTLAGDTFRSLTSADIAELSALSVKSLASCQQKNFKVGDITNKTSESVDKDAMKATISQALSGAGYTWSEDAKTQADYKITSSSSESPTKGIFKMTYLLDTQLKAGEKSVCQTKVELVKSSSIK